MAKEGFPWCDASALLAQISRGKATPPPPAHKARSTHEGRNMRMKKSLGGEVGLNAVSSRLARRLLTAPRSAPVGGREKLDGGRWRAMHGRKYFWQPGLLFAEMLAVEKLVVDRHRDREYPFG